MKLIQILAIAAALAVSAPAQNTNQNSGSSAQPKTSDAQKKTSPGTSIKVTVPKETKTGAAVQKPAAAGGNAQSKAGAQKSQPVVVVNPQQKSGANTSAAKTGATPAKSAPAKTPVVAVAPQAKPNTSASKSGPFAPKPGTAKKGKPVVAVAPKPAAPKKPMVAKKQELKVSQKAAAVTAPDKSAKKISAAGRRDPFVSPIRNVTVGATGPTCSTGKKCLYIPELTVQGTVKDNTTGEMMAVVVNRSRHTYFLRENDQVFNGLVEKITGDSVVFREFATDTFGRESAHEVVKRVSPVS